MYHARDVNSVYYIVILGLPVSAAYHKAYRFRKCIEQRMYVFNMCSICFQHSHSQNNSIRTFNLHSLNYLNVICAFQFTANLT